MDSGKQITLVNNLDQIEEVELVCSFKIPSNNQKYLIYTKNEKDQNGSVIIYIGKLESVDNKQHLIEIKSDSEWEMIKQIIREMIKYTDTGDKIWWII